ncbi:MAG: transporter [Thermoanaerobaculia bacterium]
MPPTRQRPFLRGRVASRVTARVTLGTAALLVGIAVSGSAAPAAAAVRQSLDDAWWTGPIVTASAATLPKGHFLVEPYVFNVIAKERYDRDGKRRDVARTDGYGSLTYVNYGVTDRFTVGAIPTFGYNDVGAGADSSGIGAGDVTVQAQYRLAQFREGGRLPTLSLVVQETLPTGTYDRLGTRTADGMGAGAYTTTVGVFSQYYFWLPNGRILRTRLNVSYAVSDDVRLKDVSVYGTSPGFRGRASPGDSFSVNLAGEYSVTRNWVLALDVFRQYDDDTRVRGYVTEDGGRREVRESSGSSSRLGIAPAVEYNFSATVGVIVGARWFAAGRNTDASVTPVAAINLVF